MTQVNKACDLASLREKIGRLDLRLVTEKADQEWDVRLGDMGQAAADYRHFLYLVAASRLEGDEGNVLPSKGADRIWHTHLLFTANYREFTTQVYGEFLDHNPAELGSLDLEKALENTKRLQAMHGDSGFSRRYLEKKTPRLRHAECSPLACAA